MNNLAGCSSEMSEYMKRKENRNVGPHARAQDAQEPACAPWMIVSSEPSARRSGGVRWAEATTRMCETRGVKIIQDK